MNRTAVLVCSSLLPHKLWEKDMPSIHAHEAMAMDVLTCTIHSPRSSVVLCSHMSHTAGSPRMNGRGGRVCFGTLHIEKARHHKLLGSCPSVATGYTDSFHTHQNDSYKIFIQVFISINRAIFFP
jgi:hypothetical protein